MSDKVDKLFEEIEAENRMKQGEAPVSPATDEEALSARLREERQSKISDFKLDLKLDEDEHMPPEPVPTAEQPVPEPTESEADTVTPAQAAAAALIGFSALETEGNTDDEHTDDEHPPFVTGEDAEESTPESDAVLVPASQQSKKKKKKRDRTTWGCIRGIIYAVLVLGISGTLAFFIIAGGIDMTGLNKSSSLVDVEIPRGASTEQIADILKEEGLIDQPMIFRLYSKLTKADGGYRPGLFTLSANMGYGSIIDTLQSTKPRGTVRVTIPEGSTLSDIAEIMEAKEVCSKADFYAAVNKNDYSEYDFIAAIPTEEDGEQYANRVYTLEGYLFPDTYDFYTNSSADTVIRKLLSTFSADNRVDTSIRAAIKAKGMTIDEVITMASILEGEANNPTDMARVARVLYNRLASTDYPRLECDSTQEYIRSIIQVEGGNEVINKAYDTYQRKGLPAGPINNPGMNAIRAALNPSEEAEIVNCYFFATDLKTGITYYTKTLKEHEAICKKYGIGMYA